MQNKIDNNKLAIVIGVALVLLFLSNILTPLVIPVGVFVLWLYFRREQS